MAYRQIIFSPLLGKDKDRTFELIKLRQFRREIEGWIKVDHNNRYSFADVLDKLRDKLYS